VNAAIFIHHLLFTIWDYGFTIRPNKAQLKNASQGYVNKGVIQ